MQHQNAVWRQTALLQDKTQRHFQASTQSLTPVLVPSPMIIRYDVSTSIGYGVSTSIGYGVSTSIGYGRTLQRDTESLDELRSPDFNLFSNPEYSEEEVAETMAETMEKYMSKTRADYGSGVVRPKIEDKDNFELKGQFLKELCTNTFSGSDHEDVNEHIEKVLEIVDLFHIPNITIDQVMLRAFPMSLTGAASRWLKNKPTGSITTWDGLKTKFLNKYCPFARTAKKMEEINNFKQEPDETLYQAWERFKELLMKCPQHYLTKMQEVILFYNGLEVPTRQILDSKGVIPTKTTADAKVTIQEMAEYSQKWHNGTSRTRSTKTSDGLEAMKAQLNNLEREIKKVNEKVYAAQVGSYSYGASHIDNSIPQKEKDPGSFTLPCYINNVFFENALADLGPSVSVIPLSTYLNLGLGELAHNKLTVELTNRIVKHPKRIAENVLVGIGKFIFPVDFTILDMPEDVKVPLILERPFLSTDHAKIDVFNR
ncbi:reverse transcriptase domain-containing protein [Tanacetum coccineum]